MSSEYLTASFSNAAAMMKSASSVRKAANPYEMQASMGNYGEQDYGNETLEDQYKHYTGRFYSAARLVCTRMASQPFFVGKMGVDNKHRSARRMMDKGHVPANGVPAWLGDPESIEILTGHPMQKAFANPNSVQTQYNMWDMAGGSALATGMSFIVAMPAEKRPWDIFPIPSTWMKPIKSGGVINSWAMKPPSAMGEGLVIPDDQVARTYFADPANPASVISPLLMAARSVLSDEEISSSQYNEFKNGGMPKVALIAGDVMNETGFTDDPNRTSAARPVRLEPEQRRQIISWYQQQYAGTRKSGLPIVLDAIIRDIKMISRAPAEMGYLESAGLTKEQIFEIVGVSDILTGKLDGVTRASGSLAEQFFMDYCFNPFTTMFSQTITKKLCPLFNLGKDDLVAWIAPGVHRDPELDIEYLRLGIRAYAYQRNDVRRITSQRFGGLPQLEGMDDVIIPEKLEEREPEQDYVGVGRLAVLEGAQLDNGTAN